MSCHVRDTSNRSILLVKDDPDDEMLTVDALKTGDALRRIRANQTTTRLPVVILTSSDGSADRNASYGKEANSYVRKPLRHEEFVESVQQLGTCWLVRNMLPAE